MVSRISSREAKDDVQRHKRHKSMKRSQPLHDESVLIFPISDPKYDFEYPLPKFGKESRFNLLFDYQNDSWFRWPLKNQMKPMAGDYLPVHRLLFTPERDFLINNSGHKFDASHLQDKILVILILSLRPEEREKTKHFTGALSEAYLELYCFSDIGFEVIFVAAEDAPGGGGIINNLMLAGGGGGLKQEFDDLFKLMPWLAIPYSDKHARQICEESLHDPSRFGPVSCYLLQTNGLIMHDWPAVFTIYGAKAFPFTSQRLEELEDENFSFFTDPPSMKELLGHSVISPQGHLVRADHLENKVVGLFFPVDPIINTTLPEAWEALKSRHGDFEIVLVPPPYSSSWDGHFPFSTLSDTSLCQKLWWIYHPPRLDGDFYNADKRPGVLVIIGPRQNRFCNYYGADILFKFGAEGYPFTLERAAELESEKLKKLTLASLFGTKHLVCAADRKKVGVSELLGKEVFVLVSWSSWHEEGKQLLKRLKRLVTRVRKPKRLVIRKRSEVSVRRISLEGCRTDEGFMEGDDFPIIHISAEGVSHKDYTGKDRVLLCRSRKAYYSCKSSCIGLHSEQDVLVFGRDGRVALTSWREDVGGGRVEEFLTHICDISPELLLSVLRIRYSYKNLVCWLDLSGDRKLTDIEYI